MHSVSCSELSSSIDASVYFLDIICLVGVYTAATRGLVLSTQPFDLIFHVHLLYAYSMHTINVNCVMCGDADMGKQHCAVLVQW